MKTLRFYKILVVILVLVNLGTVYFLWNSGKHHGPPGKNEIVENLGLTGSAKEQILIMQDKHFKDKHVLIQKSKNLHEKLFSYFNDKSKDSSDVVALIDQIVENQRETEQMTFDYFKEVSALCTPEQQKKLQEMIHHVLRHSGGPPPPPHNR